MKIFFFIRSKINTYTHTQSENVYSGRLIFLIRKGIRKLNASVFARQIFIEFDMEIKHYQHAALYPQYLNA